MEKSISGINIPDPQHWLCLGGCLVPRCAAVRHAGGPAPIRHGRCGQPSQGAHQGHQQGAHRHTHEEAGPHISRVQGSAAQVPVPNG